MVQISAAIIAASVALGVAVLTPSMASLRARRQAVHDKFDAALSALLLVQAARHTPTGLTKDLVDLTRDERRELTLRMHAKGIEFFVQCTAEAKVALTAIEQYVPEVRQQVTSGWELKEEDEPALRATIEQRRRQAVKAERLFLRRGALPSRDV